MLLHGLSVFDIKSDSANCALSIYINQIITNSVMYFMMLVHITLSLIFCIVVSLNRRISA